MYINLDIGSCEIEECEFNKNGKCNKTSAIIKIAVVKEDSMGSIIPRAILVCGVMKLRNKGSAGYDTAGYTEIST